MLENIKIATTLLLAFSMVLLVVSVIFPKVGGAFWYTVLTPHYAIPDFYRYIKGKYVIKTKPWHEEATREWSELFNTPIDKRDELLINLKNNYKTHDNFKGMVKKMKQASKELNEKIK